MKWFEESFNRQQEHALMMLDIFKDDIQKEYMKLKEKKEEKEIQEKEAFLILEGDSSIYKEDLTKLNLLRRQKGMTSEIYINIVYRKDEVYVSVSPVGAYPFDSLYKYIEMSGKSKEYLEAEITIQVFKFLKEHTLRINKIDDIEIKRYPSFKIVTDTLALDILNIYKQTGKNFKDCLYKINVRDCIDRYPELVFLNREDFFPQVIEKLREYGLFISNGEFVEINKEIKK